MEGDLFEYFFSGLDSEHHADQGEYDSEYESNPESIHWKSWDEFRYEEYHEDIDDEWDESECEDIEREGQYLQEWSDSTIH